MSRLYLEKKRIRGNKLGEGNHFPAMRNALGQKFESRAGEDDGLFIGYGMLPNIMPHSMQDQYSREEEDLCFDSAVLENGNLKAVFLPGLGGRLWSLQDKRTGRDLIYENPVFRPVNFALRNAWIAGGVEWNIGGRGHGAYTLSPLFTAELEDEDGTPVLRMYEFCRERGVTWQMDFFLPEGSEFLFARMRVVNPRKEVVPMYWWSNIAVREIGRQRVVAPAESTYSNAYEDEKHHPLSKWDLPFAEGFDCTFPKNHELPKDHFFNIPDGRRKFEALISEDGLGLVHASTRRLAGRKLFVWGQSPGGRHWQRRLSSPSAPDYLEIQAGLCKTQMECCPMPPESAWEWLEAYGSLTTRPEEIFSSWDSAVREAESALEAVLPESRLDSMLLRTRETFALKKGRLLFSGSAWGALENLRRLHGNEPPLSAHLDFGEPGAEQEPWIGLLKYGSLPETDPETVFPSYQIQKEWFELLKKSSAGTAGSFQWNTWLHLGLCHYYREDFERAEECFRNSLHLASSPLALYAMANLCRATGRKESSATFFRAVLRKRLYDISLAKECFRGILEAGKAEMILELFPLLPEKSQAVPMLRLLYASALAETGDWRAAQTILEEAGGLTSRTFRKGKPLFPTSTVRSALWKPGKKAWILILRKSGFLSALTCA